MKKEKWKIFIDFGYQNEYDFCDNMLFDTKEDAKKWCRENNYPLKCVVRESEWKDMCANKKRHIIHGIG